MKGISWRVEKLLASKKGLCSVCFVQLELPVRPITLLADVNWLCIKAPNFHLWKVMFLLCKILTAVEIFIVVFWVMVPYRSGWEGRRQRANSVGIYARLRNILRGFPQSLRQMTRCYAKTDIAGLLCQPLIRTGKHRPRIYRQGTQVCPCMPVVKETTSSVRRLLHTEL